MSLGQLHNEHTIVKLLAHADRNLIGQPGLAYPAHPLDRDQPLWPHHSVHNAGNVCLASNETCTEPNGLKPRTPRRPLRHLAWPENIEDPVSPEPLQLPQPPVMYLFRFGEDPG